MSAAFNTEITIKANKEDLFKLIKALYDFEKHSKKINKKNYSYLNFVEVKCEKFSIYDGKVATIKEFVAKCGEEIVVSASGPYGYFSELKETKLFEYLSEVSPNAYFKGCISGFSNCGDQWIEGELQNGVLKLSGSNVDQGDTEGDGEYGQYVNFIKKELPHSKFCKLFKINKEKFDEDSYDDFINDMMDVSLSELDYETFCEYEFSEITEEEFYEAMNKIGHLNLITFEDFMCDGYFDEDCSVSSIIYDPIKKKYKEAEISFKKCVSVKFVDGRVYKYNCAILVAVGDKVKVGGARKDQVGTVEQIVGEWVNNPYMQEVLELIKE